MGVTEKEQAGETGTQSLTEDGLPLDFSRLGSIIHRLGEQKASEIKAAIVRIGLNGTRQGHKFAERMFKTYPELRNL
jgi:hypothetical protein